MANLGVKNGVYLARFRFHGREYKRSLKTADRAAAVAALAQVEVTIHRITVGLLRVPQGIDPGDFIVSGGTLEPPSTKAARRPAPSLTNAVSEYLANLAHVAESNRYTIAVHLRNLTACLGNRASEPMDRVERRHLETFLQTRLRERSPTTVVKERDTIIGFFAWAVGQGYLATSPATDLTRVKSRGQRPPFRTVAEIEAILERGGLTRGEQWALWDCLYLAPDEIADVLSHVRERATQDVSYVLHAIPAYTGMRRGEVLRLRWSDVEFDHDGLVARSLKQSRQAVEVSRRIDLHPELKTILLDWRGRRPRGQYLACDADTPDPLTPKQANHRFWQPLRGTKWCLASRRQRFKIGFHTYRHSLASNLAAAGIDQRVIDELMGHTTEAMRRRYRHLFPQAKRAAVTCFSLAASPGGVRPPGVPNDKTSCVMALKDQEATR